MVRKVKSFIVVLVLSSFGMLVGGNLASTAVADNEDYYESLEVFSQVLHRIRQDYVEETHPDQLMLGAINGMIGTLDPYSQYMTPEQYKAFQEETSGEYHGIGVEISATEEGLRVVRPYPGSPAEKAGLEPGDIIVTVDGVEIASIGPDEAIARIKGRRGTKVRLGIAREGWDEPREFLVERDQIRTRAVSWSRLEEGYGYVRVSQFQERVAEDVRKAVKAMSREGDVEGVVLDLRGNPGGLLEEAVRLSDLFLAQGIIVSTRGRGEPEVERARKGGTLTDISLSVLIDGGSASASEIVAGALQDHGRAIIVGEPSYGKGSVQNIIRLENDGALRLTVARYYTPNGRPIDHDSSITPDVVVHWEPESADLDLLETDSGLLAAEEANPDLEHDLQLQEALAQLKHPTANRRAEVPSTAKGDKNAPDMRP